MVQCGRGVRIELDRRVYDLETIFRAAYAFTDRSYVYLRRIDEDRVEVWLTPKEEGPQPESLGGAFLNELIDQRVRRDVAIETQVVRDALIEAALRPSQPRRDHPSDLDP